MAELVGGVLVGAALNELILVLKKFKRSDQLLRQLLERLERLKPLVEPANFIQTESGSPADKWLRDLHQVVRDAQKLADDSGGSVKRMLHAGKLENINNRISELLADSNAVQLKLLVELYQRFAQILSSGSSKVVKEKELKQLTSQLERERTTYGMVNDGSSVSTSSALRPQWSRACDIPDPPEVTVGGRAVADEQIEDILHGEYRKWIVMWGMGGVGKTFTANTVFHDAAIKQHFTGGTHWVTVSKDQPPPQQILKQLYKKIKGESASSDFPENPEEARSKVRGLLDGYKILLVLDDVWESSALQYLDVVPEESVILVTTRDQNSLDFVSSDHDGRRQRIVDCAKIVKVLPLSTEDGWQLFRWYAFDVYGKSVPRDVDAIARDVAEECKGLPLALKVIGSTLGRIYLPEYDEKLGRTLEGKWKKALEQLRNMSHYEDEYESLYHKLHWSVDNLVSQDSRLKDCFFYFGAYPEDYPVPVERLVSIWAAEGICGRDEAKGLLGSLVAKSMIELTDDGRSCKVHDVMLDLIHRDLNFDGKEKISISQKKCLYAPTSMVDAFPDAWTTCDDQISAKRLSIQLSALDELPHRFNAPSLQVLMLEQKSIFKGGRCKLRRLPREFFQNMTCLKVLVLRYTGILRLRGSVLRNLKALVLLDLTGCSCLQNISDHLDRLQNLETILLGGCQSLQRLPRMKSLTKLHTFSVSLPRKLLLRLCCATVGFRWLYDLMEETLLEEPTFRCVLRPFGLRHVFQLRSLRCLTFRGEWFDAYVPDVAPLYALEMLKMWRVRRTAASVAELKNLRILEICDTLDRTLPPLDKLPLLEELSILRCHNIENLPESFGQNGAFPSLRKFIIFDMVELKKLFTFNAESMPKLETFSLSGFQPCTKIEFPISLTALTTLKSLFLDESWIEGVDFNALFREPNCFPNLEKLGFNIAMGELPQHILDREVPHGKLKIEKVHFHGR